MTETDYRDQQAPRALHPLKFAALYSFALVAWAVLVIKDWLIGE